MGDVCKPKRTVLLFKPELPTKINELYIKALQYHNFEANFISPTQFVYKNRIALRDKLEAPLKYCGIIFTSPRCVHAVKEALQQTPLPNAWKSLHNYALGSTTHDLAYSELQQLCTIGKSTNSAHCLCDLIVQTFGRDQPNRLPMLLLYGDTDANTIRLRLVAQGFRIDSCEVFEHKCHEKFAVSMERFLNSKPLEFLVFFTAISAKCVVSYLNSIDIPLKDCKLIAIGEGTQNALKLMGLKVHRTMKRSLVEHLLRALLD